MTCDLSAVTDLLSRGQVESILADPALFFAAFGLALSSCSQKAHYSAYVSGEQLLILGKEHVINEAERCVERIRGFFLEGFYSQTTFYILMIDMANDIYLRPPGEVVDLKGWVASDEKICSSWFRNSIYPAMSPLAQYLGARCVHVIICGQTIEEDFHRRLTLDIPALKIEWTDGSRDGIS